MSPRRRPAGVAENHRRGFAGTPSRGYPVTMAAQPEPVDAAAEPTPGRGAAHPANSLNELSGEEWLYFTKSVWSTAYPSELGHARRKAHGANKPPRLMCRLIEFFTRTGELVLDPFAGVGGTLLGAAIAQGPRRALGIELDPRWVAVYEEVVAELATERGGRGPVLADLGSSDPGGARTFDSSGLELRRGDAAAILPGLAGESLQPAAVRTVAALAVET